jgi:hypothetical protein
MLEQRYRGTIREMTMKCEHADANLWRVEVEETGKIGAVIGN